MGAGKVEKAAALVVALGVTALPFFHLAGWHSVGIYAHAPLSGRLLYPFFHAGVLHAALNAWSLLSLVFFYGVPSIRLCAAYLIAVSVPVDALGSFLPFDVPTVGLSGVLFVLFGTLLFEVRRRAYYCCWMSFFLCAGFFVPGVNAWLHLYCYLCGLALALFNKPIRLKS